MTLNKMTLASLLLLSTLSLFGCGKPDIRGTIQLPEGEKAFESMKLTVALVDQDTEIPIETHLTLPKGQNQIAFAIPAPNNDHLFTLRYTLKPTVVDAKPVDTSSETLSLIKTQGLSISNHVYVKEGYGNPGANAPVVDTPVFKKAEDWNNKTLEIPMHAGLKEKTATILKDIIKPNMTPLEKEAAIYAYITKNLPTTPNQYTDYLDLKLREYDNPLIEAVMNQKAVWLGYPFEMKWLLQNAGISSKLVEGREFNELLSVVYNLVEIDQKWYYCNPLMGALSAQSTSNRVASQITTDEKELAAYGVKHNFNYPEQIHQMADVKLYYEDEEQQSATSFDRFLAGASVAKPEEPKMVTTTLTFPKDFKVPNYGIYVTVAVKSSNPSKDLIFRNIVYIKAGETSKTIELPLVSKDSKVMLLAYQPKTKLHAEVAYSVDSGEKPTLALAW